MLGGEIFIGLGFPPQRLYSCFDHATPNLIILDSECGKKLPECERYCRDDIITKTYCSPLCQELDPSIADMFCARKYNIQLSTYNSSLSRTFKATNNTCKWTNQATSPLTFYGRYAYDRMEMYSVVDTVDQTYNTEFQVDNITFVQGLLVNPSTFNPCNATIGLTPSDTNIFVQFHKMGLIENAEVSFFRPPTDFDNYISWSMTVGEFEPTACTNWTYHPTVNSHTWLFKGQKLEFYNHTYEDFNIYIDSNWHGIVLPSWMIKMLLDEGKLFYDSAISAEYYIYLKSPPITMTIQIGGRQLFLDIDLLCKSVLNATHNLSNIRKTNQNLHYVDEMPIFFDYAFGSYFCFGYDYTNGLVGIGERNVSKDEFRFGVCD